MVCAPLLCPPSMETGVYYIEAFVSGQPKQASFGWGVERRTRKPCGCGKPILETTNPSSDELTCTKCSAKISSSAKIYGCAQHIDCQNQLCETCFDKNFTQDAANEDALQALMYNRKREGWDDLAASPHKVDDRELVVRGGRDLHAGKVLGSLIDLKRGKITYAEFESGNDLPVKTTSEIHTEEIKKGGIFYPVPVIVCEGPAQLGLNTIRSSNSDHERLNWLIREMKLDGEKVESLGESKLDEPIASWTDLYPQNPLRVDFFPVPKSGTVSWNAEYAGMKLVSAWAPEGSTQWHRLEWRGTGKLEYWQLESMKTGDEKKQDKWQKMSERRRKMEYPEEILTDSINTTRPLEDEETRPISRGEETLPFQAAGEKIVNMNRMNSVSNLTKMIGKVGDNSAEGYDDDGENPKMSADLPDNDQNDSFLM